MYNCCLQGNVNQSNTDTAHANNLLLGIYQRLLHLLCRTATLLLGAAGEPVDPSVKGPKFEARSLLGCNQNTNFKKLARGFQAACLAIVALW